MSKPSEDHTPLHHILLGYCFALWHLRQLPSDTPENRHRRNVWCRDHCATFAGRWFIVAIAAWLIQFSPFGLFFIIFGWPTLALLGLIAFIIGIAHLVAQIMAQKKAGPPPIDPPVDHDE